MRSYARLLPLVAASLFLGGCLYVDDWAGSDAYHEDFHSTHALSAGGRVSVESFNGSIEVLGWEQDSVEVSGTKNASSRDALNSIRIDVDSTPGVVRIRADRPSGPHWQSGVRFAIRVPHKAMLDSIATSNGRIQVEDVEGTARLHTSNGAIRMSRLKGELEARTSNGAIEADDLKGNVNLHTSNGQIRAEASGGVFEAATSNGGIDARLSDSKGAWPVRLETSNGRIELTLDSKQLPDVRASTRNSSIELRLPVGASARVRASTSHAPITVEFDELRSEGRREHPQLEGTIGAGGPLLDLESSNGPIRIRKL